MAVNFTELLSDPNFQQQMGRTGSALASGKSVGEALDPSQMITNQQSQVATQQLIDQILGQANPEKVASPLASPNLQSTGVPTNNVQAYQAQSADPLAGLKPTPVGQAGPDSVTIKQTADGTTHTVSTPSAKNLNTFGSSVPIENQVKGGNQSPFYQALLG